MTEDHLLEMGDFILYQNVGDISLVPVVYVEKKRATILMPSGIHLPLPRQTDGNVVTYPKGAVNPFAICTVIPKRSMK